jgi:hypothetical protein
MTATEKQMKMKMVTDSDHANLNVMIMILMYIRELQNCAMEKTTNVQEILDMGG